MATTVVTGSSAASRGTAASEGNAYRGVRYCTALLGSGYLGIFGGKTVDGAGTEATVNLLTFFRITGTTPATDGSLHHDHEWRRPTVPIVNAHIEDAQATALTDAMHLGQVLLTGGHFQHAAVSAVATIVTHRPASPGPEAFTAVATASMSVARAMHRASVLADGRVLVAGGFTAWATPLATAARWAPATETWAAAASMGTARMDHTQVVLADGRVLVAGGLTDATNPTSRAEIYDPAGNTWAPTGRMAYARYGHALVLLPSGQVLAVGGTGRNPAVPGSPAPLAPAELWDPASGRWRPAGAAPTARARPAAAYVVSLRSVLVAGGDSTQVDRWDVTDGRWRRSLAALPRVRRDAQAVVLPQGVVLLPGGTEQIASIWTTTEHSTLIVPGAEAALSGRLDGLHAVTATPSATALSYQTDQAAPTVAGAGGTVLPVAAPEIAFAGAHLIDRVGVAVTATQAVVAVALEAGRGHAVLTLASTGPDPDPARRFPDAEGFLVLRYGREGQMGPVRYLGRLSDVDLRLDAGFAFPADLEIGDDVTLLAGREAFLGGDPADGYAYLTASPAGRVGASAAIDRVVAAGVEVTREISYPGDAGLGAAGAPTEGARRLSSIVGVFAGNQVDQELAAAREGV